MYTCYHHLKSSPYHLNKFIERAFDAETFRKLKEQLPPEEREMAPNSFRDIFISYFDDFFVYADDYPQCILALKLVLQASRLAGIKFSAEKTKFLTTKIKVLGYGYDTRELHLTMNKNKSSAFENMKKPSSLCSKGDRSVIANHLITNHIGHLSDYRIIFPRHNR